MPNPLDRSVFPRWDAEHPGEPVIVWTSGGKDSFAVLALAASQLGPDRVIPVFRYLVDGMRCVEVPILSQLALLGIKHPLIKVPSPDTLECLRQGIYTPPQAGNKTRVIKFVDIEAYARKQARAVWTAGGEKKQDTVHRQLWLRPFEGIDTERRRLYPVHAWTHKQVRALCELKGAHLAPAFGGDNATGLGFDSLVELHDKYPDDYKRFIHAFPFAEARRLRDLKFGAPARSPAEARARAKADAERALKVSDGDRGDAAPDPDQAG